MRGIWYFPQVYPDGLESSTNGLKDTYSTKTLIIFPKTYP